ATTGKQTPAVLPADASPKATLHADASPKATLHAAFALESVNDELIFVIGPALVTLLATQVAPASGIGTAAGLAIIGTTLFALQRRTEPAPKPRPEHRSDRAGRSRRPSLPAAGLITL